MLVSYNWLKDYVDLDGVTPEELADKITNAGIEVEHLTYNGAGLKGIVIGKVETCAPHPSADKLHVCQVNLGDETVQIICGAPNVAAGQKVAVAKVGARIAGNVKIKRAKLRGEVSNGMICSLAELGVDNNLVPKEYADGIFVFEEDVPVGQDALPYLNLDDAILELDILPNSAHCLNMIGVAHEVGALLNQKIKVPSIELTEDKERAAEYVSVDVEVPDQVPYYGARVIDRIKVAPSPRWLQLRLIAAGVRPISNVVDIANYVMLEYGQPLHTFDFDAFGSNEVNVRLAGQGEKMITLDGQGRTLTDTDILITNGKTAAAVAGVMGGESSEVTDSTKRVLLEFAIFDPITVRRTSSRLQLRTDASSRYEKGIDRNRVVPAGNRAAELLARLAGARVLGGIVEQGARTVPESVIATPWQKINQVLGSSLPLVDIKDILARLGFGVQENGDILHVTVPSRRPDVTIPEDLVEEVGRIYGYDHLPATLPEGSSTHAGLTPYQKLRRRVQDYMEGCGLYQAFTYSLTTREKSKALNVADSGNEPIRLKMPMSEEHAVLRMSIVPQLTDVVQYHLNRQMPNVKLYEIGKVFAPALGGDKFAAETEHLAGVLTGYASARNWEGEPAAVDFFTAKGIIEGFFDLFGVAEHVAFKPAKREGLHPGRTADILLHDQVIGYLGQLHPGVQREKDLNDTYVFEIAVETLLKNDRPETVYKNLPRFPSTTRDIALVVSRDVPAADLHDAIREAGGPLLASVQLFDVYEGVHVDEGKKSMAFSLKFLHPERTLTDDEVNTSYENVIKTCEEKFGAQLRG